MNVFKTGILLAFLTALFMGVGALIGGTGGMIIALIIACFMNLFSYWNSDKMVLRMHRAVEANERNAPEYYEIVRALVERANMPMPKIYIIENDQPNAFATGRNPENAAVAATTGLLNRLSQEEVAGVMAHELAHVQNRDTLIMTITATFAGAISMLANFAFFFGRGRNNAFGIFGMLVAAIAAPFAASIVQMAISRTREYSADRLGAEICGHPLWLASALEKISGLAARIDNDDAERNPATAHMFIINPLHTRKMDGLFSTHPATENRIAALKDLEEEFAERSDTMVKYNSTSPQSTNDRTSSAVKRNIKNSEPWGRAKPSTKKESAPAHRSEPKTGRSAKSSAQGKTRPSIKTGRTGRWGRNAAKSKFVSDSQSDIKQNQGKNDRQSGPWE